MIKDDIGAIDTINEICLFFFFNNGQQEIPWGRQSCECIRFFLWSQLYRGRDLRKTGGLTGRQDEYIIKRIVISFHRIWIALCYLNSSVLRNCIPKNMFIVQSFFISKCMRDYSVQSTREPVGNRQIIIIYVIMLLSRHTLGQADYYYFHAIISSYRCFSRGQFDRWEKRCEASSVFLKGSKRQRRQLLQSYWAKAHSFPFQSWERLAHFHNLYL